MAVVIERGKATETAAAPEPSRAPGADGSVRAAASAPDKTSVGARVVEWLWRRHTMARLRGEPWLAWRATRDLRHLAKVTAALAQHAEEPLPESVKSDAVASELYRQAIYWALCALSKRGRSDVTDTLIDEGQLRVKPRESEVHGLAEGVHEDVAIIWRGSDREVLLRAAGSPAALAAIEAIVTTSSFTSLAALTPEESAGRATLLRGFATRLIALCEAPKEALNRVWFERLLRSAALLGFGFMLLIGALQLSMLRERRDDLAAGKPWRVSSQAMKVCSSPLQTCPQAAGYFFHTAEEDSPWFEIDLGAVRDFSAVRLKNRTDCCRDRASPLVIEVSSDQTNWTTVASRQDSFTSWKAQFSTAHARWVRVRAVRRSILHLSEVRVLP
jgi:F5/8 type C domain